MTRLLSIAILALALSACGSLLPQPGEPTKKFTIQSIQPDELQPLGVTRPHQILVDLPTLYPPIDSVRIAVKPQEQTIDYYADVEWADRLSALLQESFIYSLQNAAILRGVSRPTEGIQADYSLKIEVRKFYVEQSQKTGTPAAQVEYMVHLIKFPERHIVASRQFKHTHAIPENKMDIIVKSLNTAHLNASRALAPWVLEHVR